MMDENTQDFVSKGVCEERHQAVSEKFEDLKANIRTSKESLSSRLDEVDVALLGDRKSPGGLLRDFIDIKNELSEHKDAVADELKRHEKQVEKDFNHHKENVSSSLKFQGKAVWIAMGLSVMALGGRFFGISIDMVKGLFDKDKTPVVQEAPIIEEDDSVPEELKQLIKDYLKQKDNINMEELNSSSAGE